jgi:4-carboxymuconolactone decarboxylase
MRLEPLLPTNLSPEQRALNQEMTESSHKHLHGFKIEREDGAQLGPLAAILHFPQFGSAAWGMFTALAKNTTLPKNVHEVAILVTGARFHARYELYAHERVAVLSGLSSSKISTIIAGQRPADLSEEEGVAYDVAFVLSSGGQLSDTTYQASLKSFGDQGTAELFYLIGNYCMISVLLNGYDVPVPE